MEKKQSCHLCGLEAGNPPRHKNPLIYGFSCRRCGNYYIDSFLVDLGEPTEGEDRVILSGYTRWETGLRNQTPEILNENYKEIIENNKNYSDDEKVDKLLLYYSLKYPKKGSYPNYDSNLDYPITFSNDSNEFLYLLKDLADKSLGFIEHKAKGIFQIVPKGWKRIEKLKRLELANKEYEIESEKIMKKINSSEAEMKEKAGNGMRRSSSLARNIRDLYLQGTIEKLEKKPEIDKRIILGLRTVLKTEDINFLSERVGELAAFEKNFLARRLIKIYQDCRASSFLGHDIPEVYSEIDKKVKEILIDLEVGGLNKEKVKIPELPEKDIDTLVEMDESIQLEFKSTLQWDVVQKRKNKELRKEVIRTIAAFSNTEGGYLIIGVSDDKKIFGLEKDYSSFKNLSGRDERDVFLQTLSNVIEDKISKEFSTKINVEFYKREGKDICRIKVNFGDEPVWVKENQKDQVFYIRTQNSEKSLLPRASYSYIASRWKKH